MDADPISFFNQIYLGHTNRVISDLLKNGEREKILRAAIELEILDHICRGNFPTPYLIAWISLVSGFSFDYLFRDGKNLRDAVPVISIPFNMLCSHRFQVVNTNAFDIYWLGQKDQHHLSSKAIKRLEPEWTLINEVKPIGFDSSSSSDESSSSDVDMLDGPDEEKSDPDPEPVPVPANGKPSPGVSGKSGRPVSPAKKSTFAPRITAATTNNVLTGDQEAAAAAKKPATTARKPRAPPKKKGPQKRAAKKDAAVSSPNGVVTGDNSTEDQQANVSPLPGSAEFGTPGKAAPNGTELTTPPNGYAPVGPRYGGKTVPGGGKRLPGSAKKAVQFDVPEDNDHDDATEALDAEPPVRTTSRRQPRRKAAEAAQAAQRAQVLPSAGRGKGKRAAK
ncbi:hypothetical protein AJ80_00823 [Polytolypa hystricis UAMH7299]|uniref:Uncharacterized protein n=1 Tax=Polytolypa hystricis (strain UAMH7299) TaxID=1447883 RepID=A0A2B7Z2K9_POLH7|nr:hypothetical protein AJ80_00823 [Polytolypa hystricis UAMH7299]